MNAQRLFLVAIAVVLGGCSSQPRDRTAVHAAASAAAHRSVANTGLPVVLALDRLPKMHGGFSVDEERAAVGFIGPDRTMIVAAPMSAGGRGGALDVGLFRISNNQPVFLSDLSLNGGVQSVRIDGGRLIVMTAAYRASDRLCCPSGMRTWTYGMVRGAPVLLQSNVAWNSLPALPAQPAIPGNLAPRSVTPAPRGNATAQSTLEPAGQSLPAPLRRTVRPSPALSTPPLEGASNCMPATIYAITDGGSTIDTTDGSVYTVAPADQAISKSWNRGDGILVCAGTLIDEDHAGQHVGIESSS